MLENKTSVFKHLNYILLLKYIIQPLLSAYFIIKKLLLIRKIKLENLTNMTDQLVPVVELCSRGEVFKRRGAEAWLHFVISQSTREEVLVHLLQHVAFTESASLILIFSTFQIPSKIKKKFFNLIYELILEHRHSSDIISSISGDHCIQCRK